MLVVQVWACHSSLVSWNSDGSIFQAATLAVTMAIVLRTITTPSSKLKDKFGSTADCLFLCVTTIQDNLRENWENLFIFLFIYFCLLQCCDGLTAL